MTSTDIFMTAVCWVGSKSLSHVLACIERTKDRLLDAGAASEAVRAQIISAVMAYWSAHPGIAVSIVEKLLNYSIVTPAAVIDWSLVSDRAGKHGEALSRSWVFELVFNTVTKVTGRHRQVVSDSAAGAPEDEIAAMRNLFKSMDDSLSSWAHGTKDQMLDPSGSVDGGEELIKRWGQRWLRVFRRKSAIEEAFLAERKAAAAAAAAAAGSTDDADAA